MGSISSYNYDTVSYKLSDLPGGQLKKDYQSSYKIDLAKYQSEKTQVAEEVLETEAFKEEVKAKGEVRVRGVKVKAMEDLAEEADLVGEMAQEKVRLAQTGKEDIN